MLIKNGGVFFIFQAADKKNVASMSPLFDTFFSFSFSASSSKSFPSMQTKTTAVYEAAARRSRSPNKIRPYPLTLTLLFLSIFPPLLCAQHHVVAAVGRRKKRKGNKLDIQSPKWKRKKISGAFFFGGTRHKTLKDLNNFFWKMGRRQTASVGPNFKINRWEMKAWEGHPNVLFFLSGLEEEEGKEEEEEEKKASNGAPMTRLNFSGGWKKRNSI